MFKLLKLQKKRSLSFKRTYQLTKIQDSLKYSFWNYSFSSSPSSLLCAAVVSSTCSGLLWNRQVFYMFPPHGITSAASPSLRRQTEITLAYVNRLPFVLNGRIFRCITFVHCVRGVFRVIILSQSACLGWVGNNAKEHNTTPWICYRARNRNTG